MFIGILGFSVLLSSLHKTIETSSLTPAHAMELAQKQAEANAARIEADQARAEAEKLRRDVDQATQDAEKLKADAKIAAETIDALKRQVKDLESKLALKDN